jgi:DNA ligase-1
MLNRPMLAVAVENLDNLNYPILVSPKLDGIRCVKVDGKALTRKFKPIPNHHIRTWIEAHLPDGIDGEIITYNPHSSVQSFNNIQSDVMSEDGTPNFVFHAFDYVKDDLNKPFDLRQNDLDNWFSDFIKTRTIEEPITIVPQYPVSNKEQLLNYEEMALFQGYEGVMIRSMGGGYKCGRSTLKQGWLLKLKRFTDSEAVILGFEELLTNTNEKVVNELGLSKRSSHKAGKVEAGTLGKFKVKDITTGVEFEIGTGEGLTQALRQEIWNNRDSYLGKLVKYKYQPAGMKEKPRFPVFLGFRDERDM